MRGLDRDDQFGFPDELGNDATEPPTQTVDQFDGFTNSHPADRDGMSTFVTVQVHRITDPEAGDIRTIQ